MKVPNLKGLGKNQQQTIKFLKALTYKRTLKIKSIVDYN